MTRHVSRLDRFIHGLLWLAALVVIPLAVVVGIGRELLPGLSGLRPDIERLLSERSGLHLTLASVEGDWRGITPSFRLRGLAVHARPEAAAALVIPGIDITPDWWATLRDRDLRLRATIDGLSLTLVPDAKAGLRILELADLGDSDPEKARATLQWILSQPDLALTHHRLSWQAPESPRQFIHDVRLQQYHHAGDYRLQADFRLGELGAWQHAVVTVEGSPLDWQHVPWRAWLQLQELPRWQPWLKLLPGSDAITLADGKLSLWLDSPGGLPVQALARLQGVSLAVNLPGRGRRQAVGLSGVLAATRFRADHWRLVFDDLAGEVEGRALPLQAAAVEREDDRLTVMAARLSLPVLADWASRERLLPPSMMARLAQLKPEGVLPRAWMTLTQEAEGWQPLQGSAEFKALGWQASGSLPGAHQLAGWVHADAMQGLLHLDTGKAELDLRDVFRMPLAIDVLRGNLRWRHADGFWHVDSDVLHLRNADADTHTQLAFRLPDGHPEDATLELLARLQQGRADQAWRYVPWSSAGDDTLAWLRQALKAGRVTDGTFVYSGLVRDGPGTGRLDMRLDLADATLDYAPGWPAITELNGRVVISGQRLNVDATRARIGSAESRRIAAVIPDLERSVLSVDADLAMDLAGLDQLMAESPLKATTAEVARTLDLSGPAQARLGLVVPLAGGDVEVKVDASLKEARVEIPAQRLTFEGVSGPVRFDTRKGLDAEQLTAMLWGQQARIALSGETRGGHWQQQHVDVRVPLEVSALSRWLQTDLSAHLRGLTPVQVGLDIPVSQAGRSRLRIDSDLKGWRVLLPAPFDKPAAQPWPLAYRGSLGDGDQKGSLVLGPLLRGGLVWHDGRLDRLLLRTGVPGIAWPEQSGLFIEADVPVIDVAAWQKALSTGSVAASHPRSAASGLPALRQLTLSADRVLAGGQTLSATRAQLRQTDKGWHLNLKGLQPAVLPTWPVTELDTDIQHTGSQWQLSPLVLRQPAATFTGSLAWQDTLRASTQLKGQLDVRDLARLLEHLDLQPFMASEQALLKADLRWAGSPERFQLSSLDGSIDLKTKAGRIRDIDGIPAATRLFGLLNASNLMRRLRLDFTDVTRRGLNFDQITLQGDLKDGISPIARFELDGPSMLVRGRGWVNLNTRELDQQLRIGVPVSSAVPVVAGFLAGPIIGGALVAADLLFEKQLSKLTAVRYRLHGPWSDLKLDDEVLESLPAPAGNKPAEETTP